jgi:hypothetical protein
MYLCTTKNRGVEQLVARRAHNPKVVGSSPAAATKRKPGASARAFVFYSLVASANSLCMYRLWLFFSFLWASSPTIAQADSFTVFFFMLEDCPVTKAYTEEIKAIRETYAGGRIGFLGAFPNPITTDSSMEAFVGRHGFPFPCIREGGYAYARRFSVTVTPEVVVFDEARGQIVYQGRIDNLYERLGRRRPVVTQRELRDALDAIRQGRPVRTPRTTAVGCLLGGE